MLRQAHELIHGMGLKGNQLGRAQRLAQEYTHLRALSLFAPEAAWQPKIGIPSTGERVHPSAKDPLLLIPKKTVQHVLAFQENALLSVLPPGSRRGKKGMTKKERGIHEKIAETRKRFYEADRLPSDMPYALAASELDGMMENVVVAIAKEIGVENANQFTGEFEEWRKKANQAVVEFETRKRSRIN